MTSMDGRFEGTDEDCDHRYWFVNPWIVENMESCIYVWQFIICWLQCQNVSFNWSTIFRSLFHQVLIVKRFHSNLLCASRTVLGSQTVWVRPIVDRLTLIEKWSKAYKNVNWELFYRTLTTIDRRVTRVNWKLSARCWRENHYVGDCFRYVGDFLNVLNQSPRSWIGHRHLKLVTNTFGLQHPSPTSM